mmetsp:Transcript_59288/g.166942  ORF Transcript_59288/g.166942 Transcript_59288/m.166942 type:complete len:329 (+) Transcript_59288:523-1509(+)
MPTRLLLSWLIWLASPFSWTACASPANWVWAPVRVLRKGCNWSTPTFSDTVCSTAATCPWTAVIWPLHCWALSPSARSMPASFVSRPDTLSLSCCRCLPPAFSCTAFSRSASLPSDAAIWLLHWWSWLVPAFSCSSLATCAWRPATLPSSCCTDFCHSLPWSSCSVWTSLVPSPTTELSNWRTRSAPDRMSWSMLADRACIAETAALTFSTWSLPALRCRASSMDFNLVWAVAHVALSCCTWSAPAFAGSAWPMEATFACKLSRGALNCWARLSLMFARLRSHCCTWSLPAFDSTACSAPATRFWRPATACSICDSLPWPLSAACSTP